MAPQTTSQPELLTSWKEIASYLGKGVRTVQRWEIQFALPVRRPNEKLKGIVHATRQELDRWLEMQWSQRPKDENPVPVRVSGEHVQMMHANIEQSARLRHANRILLEDIRTSLGHVFAECEALARTMTEFPKPS